MTDRHLTPASNAPTSARLRWWEWLLLTAALVIFAAQAGASSLVKSAAFDEQYHLAAGYAYLRTGDYRLATNHPPLLGMIASLPLRDDIALPTDHPAWQAGDRYLFSDVFLWEANNDPQGVLTTARWPITLLGALLIAAIFFAGRQIIGARAGWLALLLATFDPNLIAHSRFVTTDLGLTLFIFLTLWLLWRWLAADGWWNLVAAGLAAGLAMCAKYSGAFVWPLVAAVMVVHPISGRSHAWRRRGLGLLVMAALALLVIWALYRLDVGAVSFLPAWLPIPAAFYFQNFWDAFTRIVGVQDIRLAFFLGETSAEGWWDYFFVALAVKTPLLTLALAAAGVAVMVAQRSWRRLAVVWLPIVFFLLLGATGVLNIGYRHLLPALPFILLLAANAAEWRWLAASTRRTVVAGALIALWVIAATASIAPHYESFFNALAGRWQNWSNILVDSNLDWGQDLPALRQTMTDLGIERVNLAYFGKAVPEKYGVSYHPLPGFLRFMEGKELNAYNPYTPEPGWYAISATSLRLGAMTPETADLYAVFREREPDARAGYSIYLYHRADDPQDEVVRQVLAGEAVAAHTPTDLGVAPGVRSQVRWRQSSNTAIFPRGDGFVPPADFRPLEANFDDVFTLIGVSDGVTAPPGGSAGLTLYWRKGEAAMPMPAPTRGEPISAFIHLVDGDPANKIAQFDGWETALRGLEPGDVIAQSVALDIPAETQPGDYDLLVGLYSPQDWARLPVATSASVADFAQAGVLSVQPNP
jgi:hypothetical protein